LDAFGDAMRLRVPACDVQRIHGDVRCNNLSVGALAGQCDSDAAAARARVDDRDAVVSSGKKRKCFFDDQLGLRPRNQDSRRDRERQTPELAVPDDIGERLAGRSPGHELAVSILEAIRRGRGARDDDALGCPVENELRQQPCVQIC
jgi:hypothetical protein